MPLSRWKTSLLPVPLAGSVALLLGAFSAAPMIMRHDRAESRYRDLGETYRPYLVQLGLPDREGVPRLYGGMGTMIAPTWVLTAGHTADRFTAQSDYPVAPETHYVWIMGRGYRVKAVHLHPGYVRYDVDHDIALLELETAPVNARTACLYDQRNERGRQVVNVGAGTPGNGITGEGQPDGVVRGGTATVDRAEENVLIWRFRSPDDARVTDLEGISGTGDSGGPAFIVDDGQVCVAGVSGSQRRRGGRVPGAYGVEEVYTRVSTYRAWITGVIEGHVPTELGGSAT